MYGIHKLADLDRELETMELIPNPTGWDEEPEPISRNLGDIGLKAASNL
jgi:hypothetical protein